jgi:biopolymer transport protein TolQ
MSVSNLQVGGAVPSSAWELVTNSDTLTKAILGLLAVLSLLTWAIILAKWWEFRSLERASERFVEDVEKATKFEQAAAAARRARPSPFTRVVTRAADFLGDVRAATASAASTASPADATLSAAQVEALRLVLDAEAESSRDQYGRFIPVLAMVASAAPLIGLLGTVLGVISAFVGISTRGSGNIGAVAPGVATALVATAAALSVAIPAVFGYNIFANRLNRVAARVDGFGSEVIGLMAREGRL